MKECGAIMNLRGVRSETESHSELFRMPQTPNNALPPPSTKHQSLASRSVFIVLFSSPTNVSKWMGFALDWQHSCVSGSPRPTPSSVFHRHSQDATKVILTASQPWFITAEGAKAKHGGKSEGDQAQAARGCLVAESQDTLGDPSRESQQHVWNPVCQGSSGRPSAVAFLGAGSHRQPLPGALQGSWLPGGKQVFSTS